MVTTLAGGGGPGGVTSGFRNGYGTDAMFNQPVGVAITSNNTIFVADLLNYMIRRISPAGDILSILSIN